jgi:hypothetical protein
MSDGFKTLHVSTKEMTSSYDQPCDIKGALFKPLYLRNYMTDWVSAFELFTKGSVID